jgi:hypothetical protein
MSNTNDCAPGGHSCTPDAVSVVAQQRGITPSDWVPSIRRTPQQVADALVDAGYQEDDAGRVLFDNMAMGGLTPAFDPNLRTPQTGFRGCLDRLRACNAATGQLDACVAAAPRCASAQPWLDDPDAFDCCPSSCLIEYMNDRDSMSPSRAFLSVTDGMCYPGLQSYLEGKTSP